MKRAASELSSSERQKLVEIIGNTVLMLEEERSIAYIAKQLNLRPHQVAGNIDTILCIIREWNGGKWDWNN